MIFYDFEVFKYNWLVCAIDPADSEPRFIWDDPSVLEKLYGQYKNDIWIGFNNRHYDQYVFKAILCGFRAWDMNEHIIIKNLPGWAFSAVLRDIFMINYDVMPLNNSLKQLEGFQGHTIKESDVPFDLDRPLTEEEKRETEKYCLNDVRETMNVFSANISDFTALLWLVQEFKFPLSYMGKTKAQISAEILECQPVERSDEFDLTALPCLQLNNYWAVQAWFESPASHCYKTADGKKNGFIANIAGVKHLFGWGGVHGAREKYHYRCDRDHLLLHVDVASYYPRLMIFHNLLTRNARKPERYRQIFERRLALKHAGKKKEQAPLKIVLNGTFGICKDKANKAYDPRNANLICMNGQLLLIDLIEKLEEIESFELIQSNTDGLIIKIERRFFDMVDDVCYEWEQRCNMILEFDYIREIWQKDVNNYMFVDYEGKTERKGGYVKELSAMDNDLPIINRAITEYMLNGTPVEETIYSADKLIEFQKICKLTNKFDYVTHNNQIFRNKCFRIFASTRRTDGTVYKIKTRPDGSPQYFKFANTSDRCFIENGDITETPVPDHLDRQFYIDLAKERLSQFGI